jgi:hypothetical protein
MPIVNAPGSIARKLPGSCLWGLGWTKVTAWHRSSGTHHSTLRVPLPTIHSDSAPEETDRREWSRATSDSLLGVTANRALRHPCAATLVFWLGDFAARMGVGLRDTRAGKRMSNGTKLALTTEMNMNSCLTCDHLMEAALEASRLYHGILATVEAAHISRRYDLAMNLGTQVIEALSRRDEAVRALSWHRQSHARARCSAASAAA